MKDWTFVSTPLRAFTLPLLAAVVALPAAAAPPAAAPTRVVDRTVSCSTLAEFGRHFVRVGVFSANPGADMPAWAYLSTSASDTTTRALAGLEAGPAPLEPTGSVRYNRRVCRLAGAVVPLSSRGLSGSPAEVGGSRKCPVPGRVVVRMRAVLDRTVSWRTFNDLLVARGNFTTAALAVRTQTGKPIAYLTFASGKTRLWNAGSCTR